MGGADPRPGKGDSLRGADQNKGHNKGQQQTTRGKGHQNRTERRALLSTVAATQQLNVALRESEQAAASRLAEVQGQLQLAVFRAAGAEAAMASAQEPARRANAERDHAHQQIRDLNQELRAQMEANRNLQLRLHMTNRELQSVRKAAFQLQGRFDDTLRELSASNLELSRTQALLCDKQNELNSIKLDKEKKKKKENKKEKNNDPGPPPGKRGPDGKAHES